MALFERYIAVDYSGADTPNDALEGIRVVVASVDKPPRAEPGQDGWDWSRSGLCDWLMERLREPRATLVGLDHCFSFPKAYLDQQHLKSWDDLLGSFDRMWKTRTQKVKDAVTWEDFAEFRGRAGLRLTERFTSSAKSVFNHRGAGVAHSSFAGIPWLADLRRVFRGTVHFWPFDAWRIPDGKSCVAEVYPSIFSKRYDAFPDGDGDHAHDAYSVCRWMKENDERGVISRYFDPPLSEEDRACARDEGWILGVA